MESGGFNFFLEVLIPVGWRLCRVWAGCGTRPLLLEVNAQLLQNRGFPESMCGAAHLFHQEM